MMGDLGIGRLAGVALQLACGSQQSVPSRSDRPSLKLRPDRAPSGPDCCVPATLSPCQAVLVDSRWSLVGGGWIYDFIFSILY